MNGTPIVLTQFQDNGHPLLANSRNFWRVDALIGGVETIHVPATQWIPNARSNLVSNALLEIRRRHALVLNKFAGEPCTIFIRRAAGSYCRNGDLTGDGYRHTNTSNLCPYCLNTNIEGGYVKMTDRLVRIRNPQKEVELKQDGIVFTEGRTAWLGAYPLLSTGDFFIRASGQRFAVGNVRPRELQGFVTLQMCSIKEVEPQNPIYDIDADLIFGL